MTTATQKASSTDKRVAKLLDRLADLREQVQTAEQARAGRRAVVLAPVQAQLDAIEDELGPGIADLTALAEEVEQSVREVVVAAGHTINGTKLQAKYVRGKAHCDVPGLLGLAKAVPAIKELITTGEPSVSICWRKDPETPE